MINLRVLAIASLIGLSIFASSLDAKPIYKWKDSEGNIKYTQTRPPKGVEFSVLNYRQAKGTSSTSKDGSTSSKPAMSQEDEILAKQAAEQKRVDAQEGNRKQKNCTISQTNLKALEGNTRIQVEEDGKRRMLTDKERADKLANAKENVDKFCNK